jgi:hypothetical protein
MWQKDKFAGKGGVRKQSEKKKGGKRKLPFVC